MPIHTIAIFGGGMAGLTVAHELAHRGFEVHVYEASRVGGKSASHETQGLPGPSGGRLPLPGEHGFRFFPGFYRHVIATMDEIPGVDGRPVSASLVASDEAAIAWPNGPLLPFNRRVDVPPWDIAARTAAIYEGLGFAPQDVARMAWFRLKYATSCEGRREDYDELSWWQFIDGDSPRYTDNFREFERSIPRTLSAMVAETSSARVIGDVGLQMLLGYGRPWENQDRVLVGPTSERFLDPWRKYLESLGVRFHERQRLGGFKRIGDRIQSARVQTPTGPALVTADAYVVAIPVEAMQHLLQNDTPLRDAYGPLQALAAWHGATDWMVGAQFYLRDDQPMAAGHVFYPKSEWALTSISQGQFWAQGAGPIAARYGDGTVRGILSVDVSDWSRPSARTGRAARQTLSRSAILQEILDQLRDAVDPTIDLSDANVAGRWLDENIVFAGPTGSLPQNRSPLLVHRVGHMRHRPAPRVGLENLYLASDYVKTHTLLATMEGANEAGRLAVNALLEDDGSLHTRCAVWPLHEEPYFATAKAIDRARHAAGLPHVMDRWPFSMTLDLVALGQQLQTIMQQPNVLSLLP